MTSKHTPGPWEAHQRPASPIEYGHHVTTADGLTVCNVTYQLPARVDGEVVEVARIANAYLIAAAPDLLSFAETFIARIEDDGEPTPGTRWHAEYVAARAAIAKATGEPK